LLMEIESRLMLFGPWRVFEARLREELRAQGFRHRIVVAPIPIAARMLANLHDGRNIDCPLAWRRSLAQKPLDRNGQSRESATGLTR
ncbi:DNA polymerase Y family protein, partial [Pseudomonas syringae pv. tagetis]